MSSTLHTKASEKGYESTEISASGLTVSYPLGENLEQMVDLFGIDAVYAKAKSGFQSNIVNVVRTAVKANKDLTSEEAQKHLDGYVAGAGQAKLTDVQKAAKSIANMSVEERKALLADLEASVVNA